MGAFGKTVSDHAVFKGTLRRYMREWVRIAVPVRRSKWTSTVRPSSGATRAE